jgi:hypothetical protein
VDSISVGRFDQNQAVQRLSLSQEKNEMKFSHFLFETKTFGGVFELHFLRNA